MKKRFWGVKNTNVDTDYLLLLLFLHINKTEI